MEYSQNSVCMTWRWKAVALVVACLCLMVSGAHASGDVKALQLRDNVVSIVTEFSAQEDRWNDQGFGFIVGERNGNAIIVTANHVVRGKYPRPDQRTDRVKVTYYSDQGRKYQANILGTFIAKLDLAVLEAKLPSHVKWHADALGRKERICRSTEVWYIGRSGKWHVPTTPGKINDEALGGIFIIDDLNVRPGTSGAPVVSQNGILGMVITDCTGSESQAISIEVIQKAFKRWNLPWLLAYESSYSDTPQSNLDLEIESLLKDEPQPPTQAGPDISGQWYFQTGNYLFGVFVPTGTGYFNIQRSGINQYQFSQFTAMNQLESNGVIFYEDQQYKLIGKMAIIGPYSCTLEHAAGKLTGTIYMKDVEAVIILTR